MKFLFLLYILYNLTKASLLGKEIPTILFNSLNHRSEEYIISFEEIGVYFCQNHKAKRKKHQRIRRSTNVYEHLPASNSALALDKNKEKSTNDFKDLKSQNCYFAENPMFKFILLDQSNYLVIFNDGNYCQIGAQFYEINEYILGSSSDLIKTIPYRLDNDEEIKFFDENIKAEDIRVGTYENLLYLDLKEDFIDCKGGVSNIFKSYNFSLDDFNYTRYLFKEFIDEVSQVTIYPCQDKKEHITIPLDRFNFHGIFIK
jgi:hypothetical protein